MVRAYLDALPTGHGWTWESLQAALQYCRLHLALQWLGWAAAWTPPPSTRTTGSATRSSLPRGWGCDAVASRLPEPLPIVNADDFGQSPGITRGVIAAHERGIVTSASLMVRWPSANEAAAYARPGRP